MILGASSDKANAVFLVKVVLLASVRIQLSCQDDIWELSIASWWFGLFAFHAIQVTIENAGVPLLS